MSNYVLLTQPNQPNNEQLINNQQQDNKPLSDSGVSPSIQQNEDQIRIFQKTRRFQEPIQVIEQNLQTSQENQAANLGTDEERGEAATIQDEGPQLSKKWSQNESSQKDSEPSLDESLIKKRLDTSMTHVEVKNEFLEKHTWELWMIFVMKMVTSLVFLMDDLTFLVFCEKEFNMTDQEAGILFCVTAICLFGYGLTISGYLIDRLGVKYSLAIGFTSITLAKFLLTFANSLTQLYLIMCTISPFGISIIFPCLVLGVKKLSDDGSFRSICFSFYYAFMVLGALLGGPIVDFIRRDIGRMQFEYLHTNVETGITEKRFIEVSAWRTIQFFGFLSYSFMLLVLCSYRQKSETIFEEPRQPQENNEKCSQIFFEIMKDYRFWRYMLFSMLIVGAKMVFALLFFMVPKIITQDDGPDAPFGLYIAVAPLLIIIFLLLLTPIHAQYNPYNLILIGCTIATLGPIPMFFGMDLFNFLLFTILVSFAEALYAPMINVFTFTFTKVGREGTFLTLTAAPTYFTMALTGIVGGYLLENYYPAKEDATHKRRPEFIWLTIMTFSGISTFCLFIGRNYFNLRSESDQEKEDIKSSQSSFQRKQAQNDRTNKNLSTTSNKKKGSHFDLSEEETNLIAPGSQTQKSKNY